MTSSIAALRDPRRRDAPRLDDRATRSPTRNSFPGTAPRLDDRATRPLDPNGTPASGVPGDP